jgi:hypothetical protein
MRYLLTCTSNPDVVSRYNSIIEYISVENPRLIHGSLPSDSGLWFDTVDFDHLKMDFDFSFWMNLTVGGNDIESEYGASVSYTSLFPEDKSYFSYSQLRTILSNGNYCGHSSKHFFRVLPYHDELALLDEAIDDLMDSLFEHYTFLSQNQSQCSSNRYSQALNIVPSKPITVSTNNSRVSAASTIQASHLDKDLFVNLDVHSFSSLVTIADTMTFIPEKFVKRCRSVYISYMKLIISKPEVFENWLKFLLLPTIMFSETDGDRKTILRQRLDLLIANDWSDFRLSEFGIKCKWKGKARQTKEQDSDNKQKKLKSWRMLGKSALS